MQSVYNQENQRLEPRRRVCLESRMVNENIQSNVMLVDISRSGLGFITHESYSIGDILEIELPISSKQIISLKVKIRNIAETISAKRFGAELINIPQKYLEFILPFFGVYQSPFMKTLRNSNKDQMLS